MDENKSNSRAKKTLQSSKEFAKINRDSVTQERDKILEAITNTIIDCKVAEKEAKLKTLTDMYDENEVDAINALKLDEISEKRKLSEEYESIVRKQLQMLQADERGKIALQNEIAEIKSQQRKRSDSLKARKKALLIEKERSKRIAALPPPLPKSVRQLLKEQGNKSAETQVEENILPRTLDIVEEVFEEPEDKENMDYYHEQRRLMQEEFDRKAKKRFNDALKKDRQKQEHARFLKDIENAERINRRQMARSVSDTSEKVPCALPDRLNYVEKQSVMENAVENVFKKSSKTKRTKEHAIEDLEGYEDKWEAKYKQIESNMETKMIDCVPSFVKQNYSYLLEEEPAQQCGSRFAKLDESIDELNMAFAESPTEPLNSDRIAAVINHLDQMMSESNEVYEKEFKPLLEAENLKGDLPVLESFDKAVEANILRLPTEDKSVEVCEEMTSRNETSSTSRSTQANLMNSGLMAFKRKKFGPVYKSLLGNLSDPLTQSPTWTEPQATNGTLVSWSSSSYYSLPSRHGQPDICNLCDSPSCKLPLVEDINSHKDCIPLSKKQDKDPVFIDLHEKSQQRTSDTALSPTSVKSKISSYVQLVADKYLKKPSEIKPDEQVSSRVHQVHSSEDIPFQSDSTEAAEEIASDDSRDFIKRQSDLLDSEVSLSKPSISAAVERSSSKAAFEEILQKTGQMILAKIPSYSDLQSLANLDKSKQDEFKKRCHEILSESLSNISGHDETDEELDALKAAISDEVFEATKKKIQPGEFIYHELSTIHEADSALTNDTMQSRRGSSKRPSESGRSSTKSSSSPRSGFLSPEEIDTTSTSLVDAPASEVSELAKEIRFVAEPSAEPFECVPQEFQPTTPCDLISGTLTTLQTPSSRIISEVITPRPATISDVIDTPSFLTMTDARSNASTPSTLRTEMSLQTPSSQFSTHSLQSGMSYGTPYSSSFQSTNVKHPHLTNLETLPKYFKDISSIKQDSSSSQESARVIRPIDDRQTIPKSIEKSNCNVKHPHLANLKTLPKYFKDISSIKQDSSSSQESARVIRPIEDRQTIPKSIEKNNVPKQIFFPNESSTNSFKPMTPHSCVSSPGLMYHQSAINSKHSKESVEKSVDYRASDDQPCTQESTRGSFKPMTPRSYMSSPSKAYSKGQIDDEEKFDNKATLNRKGIGSHTTDSGSFQPMTPHSYFSTPNLPSERCNERDFGHQTQPPLHEVDSTASGFFPMTPHSHLPSPNMSSPQERNERHQMHSQLQQKSALSSFQPMTPHSNVSTPNMPSQTQQKKDTQQLMHTESRQEDTASAFQPMTPHSYFSTPSPPSEKPNERNSNHQSHSTLQEQDNTASGFQTMTPHSHFSTPNLPSQQVLDSNFKNNQQWTNSPSQKSNAASGFQSMAPYSDVPCQTDGNLSSIEDLRHQSTSTVNLRLRIPSSEGSLEHSIPRSDAPEAINTPSDKSLKLRFNVKVPNLNPDTDVEDYVMGDGSFMQREVNIPIQLYLKDKVIGSTCNEVKHGSGSRNKNLSTQNALKVSRSDFFVPKLSTADLAINKDTSRSQLQKVSKVCSSDTFVPQLSTTELDIGKDAKTSELQNLKAAKVSGSDFFIPKLSPKDFPSEPSRMQKGYFSRDLADCQEIAYEEQKIYSDSTPSVSSVASSGCKSSGSKADHEQLGRLVESSSKDGASSSYSDTPYQSVDSPNPILEALKKKFALNSSSKTSSLCATPSLTSQESLSGISVSKVTCQSTPVKTIEDIIQETGILDEPDLTLITTNLTIKPESPEKTRHFSEKSNLREGDLATSLLPNSPISVQTPTTASKVTSSYCESPSMMSFLQHEMSCFADSKAEANTNLVLNTVHETLMSEDEFGGQQFTKKQPKKFEYKKRTKRLWNNLEEVKTRKLEEERKKQSAENRLKMKSYSKVYNKKTPEL